MKRKKIFPYVHSSLSFALSLSLFLLSCLSHFSYDTPHLYPCPSVGMKSKNESENESERKEERKMEWEREDEKRKGEKGSCHMEEEKLPHEFLLSFESFDTDECE